MTSMMKLINRSRNMKSFRFTCAAAGAIFVFAILVRNESIVVTRIPYNPDPNRNESKCCMPCNFPKDTCCMLCKDVSDPREHDLLMASMEGLTLHIMSKHGNTKGTSKQSFLKDRSWSGNSHIGNRDKQATFYYDWTKALNLGFDIQHVCEIGMNGGHSAMIFLAALATGKMDNDSSMTMFDLGEWTYSRDVESYLKTLYPRRFHDVIYGDSKDKLPMYIESQNTGVAKKCDVFSVDGDHRYLGAKTDILNAAKASRKGGMIILDDMDPEKDTRKGFDDAVRDGVLKNPKCFQTILFTGYDDRYDLKNSRKMDSTWCTAVFA